jgi:hypothetical protein
MDVVSAWDNLSYFDGLLFSVWVMCLYYVKVWIDNRWNR